ILILYLSVQGSVGPLNDQFREFGSIPSGFNIQREYAIIIPRDLICFQAVLLSVRVIGSTQGETCAWGCVLRYVDIDLFRRKAWCVVIYVLYLNCNHADLLVVGKHFHGKLALGVLFPAFGIHINKVWGGVLQHPEVGFFPLLSQFQLRILGNVSNDALNFLLRY
uniref:Uncharacterized protein n=1 Tax=Cyprinus carpio TaxID=7962 RepID=A0A8C1QRR1_CYPCA